MSHTNTQKYVFSCCATKNDYNYNKYYNVTSTIGQISLNQKRSRIGPVQQVCNIQVCKYAIMLCTSMGYPNGPKQIKTIGNGSNA